MFKFVVAVSGFEMGIEFPPMAHLQRALPDVTIPNVADWIIARRASRRRRCCEAALPVVIIRNDAAHELPPTSLSLQILGRRFSAGGANKKAGEQLARDAARAKLSICLPIIFMRTGM